MLRASFACAFVGLVACSSLGAVSLVTNEAVFGTNDTIDWAQFGPRGANVPGLIGANSAGGRSLWAESFSSDLSCLSRVDQWAGNPDPFTGWAGNFAAGEQLLSVSGADLVTPPTTDARLNLRFTDAIQGFGAQFDANFSNSWMMHIQAFDAEDNLLGLFDLSMKRSGGFADNTAQFMGVRSDTANIARLEIWATAIYSTGNGPTIAPDYFAMNFGRLVIPSPGTFVLAMGAALIANTRRRNL